MMERQFSRERETVRKEANGNARNENTTLEMKNPFCW